MTEAITNRYSCPAAIPLREDQNMSVYVWTEKAARIARDASLTGKPATVCGHPVRETDALAEAWVKSGYVEAAPEEEKAE